MAVPTPIYGTPAISPFPATASAAASAFQIINPALDVLYENTTIPFAHEAGVFIQQEQEDSLFITSNLFPAPASPSGNKTEQKTIQLSRLVMPKDGSPVRLEAIDPPGIIMPNGGVNYEDGMVFCAQGDQTSSGGLVFMQPTPPYNTRLLVGEFEGQPFNSPNDVVAHKDGSLWFTDPLYGSEQGIRPPPKIPQQVYRFDPKTNSTRVVADGFGRPNGISFSPDQQILYVSDTDFIHGDGSTDENRARAIFAFDIAQNGTEPTLTNRRLFAKADAGIPDGIKCDTNGNVYSGCGDGIHVWNPKGELLGKILIEKGAANFAFGRNGAMFILNENKLWKAQLGNETKGALLGI
ncbi:hypothetical protein HIM_02809 [Hirsutella minnesotensis 3608]|nr:hypothetical protein HIM_02809 [Hirsutella minnesotensis 3608]